MALSQPILSCLRPLGPPRPASMRHLLRFSTSRSRFEAPSSPLSQTPDASTPPTSSPSPPQSRAADIAAAEAATDADNPTSPIPSSTSLPSKRTPNSVSAPEQQKPLKFHVARTPSNFLPVYKDAKAGGNKHLTTVRKVTGDATRLRDELSTLLDLPKGHAFVNPVTGHVVVKGWYKNQIVKYLESKNF